jgi:hypothetical protein
LATLSFPITPPLVVQDHTIQECNAPALEVYNAPLAPPRFDQALLKGCVTFTRVVLARPSCGLKTKDNAVPVSPFSSSKYFKEMTSLYPAVLFNSFVANKEKQADNRSKIDNKKRTDK